MSIFIQRNGWFFAVLFCLNLAACPAWAQDFEQESERDRILQLIEKHIVSRNELKQEDGNIPTQTLTAITINLGLGDEWIYIPEYETRFKGLKPVLKSVLMGKDPITKEQIRKPVDVAFFQEIWHEQDHHAIVELAGDLPEGQQYLPAIPEQDWKDWVRLIGMQILVRKGALKKNTTISTVNIWPLPSTLLEKLAIQKAVLHGSIQLKDGTPILLANSHFSVFASSYAKRLEQAKEFADFLRKISKDRLVLVGADLNASPVFENAKDGQDRQWEKNRNVYAQFYLHTTLMDAYQAVAEKQQDGLTLLDPGFTWHQPNTLIDHPKASAEIRNEPNTRVDSLWFGKVHDQLKIPQEGEELRGLPPNDFHIDRCEVILDKPVIPFDNPIFHMSDHYGVYAEITLPLQEAK